MPELTSQGRPCQLCDFKEAIHPVCVLTVNCGFNFPSKMWEAGATVTPTTLPMHKINMILLHQFRALCTHKWITQTLNSTV